MKTVLNILCLPVTIIFWGVANVFFISKWLVTGEDAEKHFDAVYKITFGR